MKNIKCRNEITGKWYSKAKGFEARLAEADRLDAVQAAFLAAQYDNVEAVAVGPIKFSIEFGCPQDKFTFFDCVHFECEAESMADAVAKAEAYREANEIWQPICRIFRETP